MAVDNDVMSLKDMGFTASGKLSEGQGIVGVGQFAKSLEKANLGRLEASEYQGGAGLVDNMLRMTKAIVGRDTVSKEVREYSGWLKKDGAESYKTKVESFLELDGQQQIERMSGGDANIKSALETLFTAHKRGQSGELTNFKDRLGDVWDKAEDWRKGQYEADKGVIDEYMKGAEKAKTETFNSLWEMWDVQNRLDLVKRTAYDINSSDHNRARNPRGEGGSVRPPLEGGLIRRTLAFIKGTVPTEIKERATTVLVGSAETRNLAVRNGLSELKHDALGRASEGSLDRYKMFVKGVISKEELGKEPRQWSKVVDELEVREQERVSSGGEKDTRYLKRIAKLREGKGVSKATDAGQIAYYERFYSGLEKTAHNIYDQKKADWGKYASKAEGGFATGMLPARLTEVAMKLSAMGVDGTFKVVKGVDGTVGLAIESMDTVMADWAIGRIGEATVGRELAAAEHQKSATIFENVDPKESAKLIRGAEAVWQRSAMLAGRTADTLEFSRTSPAMLHVPGALMVEGADLALGGVSVGEKSGKIMESLSARNEKLLSAKTLIAKERGNLKGSEYKGIKETVDQEVNEIFADLPEQFENWEAMNEWVGQKQFGFEVNLGGLGNLLEKTKFTGWINDLVDLENVWVEFRGIDVRKKMLEAIGKITDPDKMKSAWGKILNAGSARRTKAEVLGLEKHEGSRIYHTESQVPLQDQMVIVKKRIAEGAEMLKTQSVDTSTGYDSILEHATLTELSEAQTRWLKIQKDRMVRRSKLDSMWESVPKAAVASAGAFAGMFAFQFLGNHFHEVITKLGIDLGDAKTQLQYAQEALKATGDPANFVDPEYARTHQEWSQQAGQYNVAVDQQNIAELGKELFKGKLKEVASYGMTYLSGLTTLAASGFAAIKLGGGALTPFFGGSKVARMTGLVEDQPNIQ